MKESIIGTTQYLFSSCPTFDITVYVIMLLSTFAAAWKAPGWIRTIGKIALMLCIFCFLHNAYVFIQDISIKNPTIMMSGSSREFSDLLRTNPDIYKLINHDFRPLMMEDMAGAVSSVCLGGFTYLINSITCIIRLPRL